MTHYIGILDGSGDAWVFAFPICPAATAAATRRRRRSPTPYRPGAMGGASGRQGHRPAEPWPN